MSTSKNRNWYQILTKWSRRICVFTLTLVGLVILASLIVPRQHLFWMPLSASDPIGFATRTKIRMLAANPQQCRKFLEEAKVSFKEFWSNEEQGICSMKDVIRIEIGMGPYRELAKPFMTCPMVVAQHIWEAKILKPEALKTFDSEVIAVEHLGAFNCRRQYGLESGPVSQHASANAFDIAAVHLQNGQKIDIEKHWFGQTAESAFLKRTFAGGCTIFSVALGPDFNAQHANHFHFDLGSGSGCR